MGRQLFSVRTTVKGSVAAFALAPAVGSYAYALLLCGWALLYHPASTVGEIMMSLFGWAVLMAMAGAALSYAGIVLVGVPAWLVLRTVRGESLPSYALVGLVGGLAVPLLLPNLSVVSRGSLAHCQIAGMFVMASFWLIAKERSIP